MRKEKKTFTIKSFYEYLGEGRLIGTRCCECNVLTLPPRPICPACLNSNLEWFEFKGKGKIETFTHIHVASPSLANRVPYVIGVVRLEEGPLIIGRILVDSEIDKITPDDEWELTPLKEGNRAVVAFKSTRNDLQRRS